MGKYKNLLSNTFIFALGTFSSKVLVFFLMPFYTRLLDTQAYGTMDLVVNTCNFLIPVISACMAEAIIRFTLDGSSSKKDVYSIGLQTILIGYVVLLIASPLLKKITLISDYTVYIFLYVLTSSFRSITTNFVRSLGFVKLFAIDGMITTASTVLFNVIFLAVFRMGAAGYVLATIVADGLSGISLFFMLRLHRFVRFKGINKKLRQEMLRYSLPLVPTALGWWITNLSDRYMMSYMVTLEANGLYSAAYKIPTMITLVSAIFIQAWQLSAFDEFNSKENVRFYSNVFRMYYTFIFMAASGIILLIRPITKLLVAPDYYESWKSVPFLVLAVSFSCFVTFLGTIYNAAKNNTMSSVTTFIGAALNIAMNLLLIPKYQAQGAAFSTFISYFIVFIIRAIDTRRFVKLKIHPSKIVLTLGLLLLQVWISLAQPPLHILWQILILFTIVLLSAGYIVFFLRQIFQVLQKRFG